MSYMNLSLTDLVAILNSANGTTFAESDFVLGTPQVVAGSWNGQSTVKNTGIRLTATEGSIYQGTKPVVYDRLSMGVLDPAKLKGFKIAAYEAVTTHDLIPMIAHWNGIHLTTDDIEDTPLTDAGNNTQTGVLAAKPGSIGWYGSVNITVVKGGAALNDLIAVTDLPGLNYPTENESDTFALVYMYGYDFTSFFEQVSNLPTGVLSSGDADALVTTLKAVDVNPAGKDLWNNTVDTAWSLNGATVVSNGLNTDTSKPTNTAYKYVLALQLAAGVTTPSGVMYLHYNDPFDPDAA